MPFFLQIFTAKRLPSMAPEAARSRRQIEEAFMIRLTRLTIACGISSATLLAAPSTGAQATDVAGATASLNGIEMYYEVQGEGDPLVLLHGFTGSHADWEPVIAELSKSYRLVVPDLRGHGRSTNPGNEFTHRQSALDVAALLDRLGIDRFKAMGISTGGMTLLHMATREPARVEAMVLIGATIYFPESARDIMRGATLESRTEEDWKRMRERHLLGDEQIKALWAQFHGFKDSYDDMDFTAPYLSTIDARTLIVHGDRDRFFPVEIPVAMYTAIPKSYLWLVPNGGHVPILGDMTAPFVRTASDFLSGKWEETPGR
jgi:pimeloyl-ACP methyl ester carboxylesterase